MKHFDRLIKENKFKLKFRIWQRANDEKIEGMLYDQVFELFMYDIVEPFVEELILSEVGSKDIYHELMGKIEKLQETIVTRNLRIKSLITTNRNLKDKVNSFKSSAREILNIK